MRLLNHTKYIEKIDFCMTKISRPTLKSLKMHKALDDTSETAELSCERIDIFGIELDNTILDSFEINTNSGHRRLEFVTHISEKLCTNTLLMIETETEIIERIHEWTEFIFPLVIKGLTSRSREVIECIRHSMDWLK